jgi:hypothetical protein
VAISLLQKIKLAFRGWTRRRAEDAKQRNAEFLAKNTGWGAAAAAPAAAAPAAPPPARAKSPVDREGLQVAYLDDSGAMEHYLDTQSGEVIEFSVASPLCDVTQNPSRFRRIPTRTPASEQEDRRAFALAVEDAKTRERLTAALMDPAEFRRVLSTDRAIERAWYNFKNDRANAAIEAWLRTVGVG